ncbi:MAG: hypothetical protein H5U01_01910 [Clostridia bacterium]|nr:hypothetical protein [Clostridia bacterium]
MPFTGGDGDLLRLDDTGGRAGRVDDGHRPGTGWRSQPLPGRRRIPAHPQPAVREVGQGYLGEAKIAVIDLVRHLPSPDRFSRRPNSPCRLYEA